MGWSYLYVGDAGNTSLVDAGTPLGATAVATPASAGYLLWECCILASLQCGKATSGTCSPQLEAVWGAVCPMQQCCVGHNKGMRWWEVIYKAYDVVVDIWVSIPCTAGTPFKRIYEKLGAVTRDLAMTYKLVVTTVGLCRNALRIGGGFSWEWSKGNELWDLVAVRNLFARCGSSSCLVSTAAVGQQFVDREGGMFCVKRKWKIVTMLPMLIEVMAPYTKIPRAPGPCSLQALRWEGLRSSALSGFSSGCRDPATAAAFDDLTVLRTPRGEWKFLCLFRAALLEQSECLCDHSSRGTQFAREPTSEMSQT